MAAAARVLALLMLIGAVANFGVAGMCVSNVGHNNPVCLCFRPLLEGPQSVPLLKLVKHLHMVSGDDHRADALQKRTALHSFALT